MYHKVILKLSGELFAGTNQPVSLDRALMLAGYIHRAIESTQCQVGIVVGGGNIIRGRDATELPIDRAMVDYMGMTATAINGIALSEALKSFGHDVRLTNSLVMPAISEPFAHLKIAHHFEQNRVVIFAGGLGRPFHSTDSAAAQVAAEFGADIILKASTVDGVYDRDPRLHPDAKRYTQLTYQQAIVDNLRIMDQEALAKCRDNNLRVLVFLASDLNFLPQIIQGDPSLGTLITN